ncbi:MAG: hypothetical protein JWM47_2838 [Acidimicrobiales bacterium]|nr:hypothetical protein [Acidimicrobiales bacterium]
MIHFMNRDMGMDGLIAVPLRYRMNPDGIVCNVRVDDDDQPFACTRDLAHRGSHIATGEHGELLALWDDEVLVEASPFALDATVVDGVIMLTLTRPDTGEFIAGTTIADELPAIVAATVQASIEAVNPDIQMGPPMPSNSTVLREIVEDGRLAVEVRKLLKDRS